MRSGYAQIAAGKIPCRCTERRSGHADPARFAESVGYAAESFAALPEGAKMWLSCGNPLAFAGLSEGQIVLDLGPAVVLASFRQAARSGRLGAPSGWT